ncbi:hypothetical protein THAR02_03254 [Trichoderma harzianum]|uniref:Major facilitator superfamily (MFS) profile domain-containing protein n=1 Tax=Trichoderma harzianum TaxID=5544 RepID=A0A0F9XI97_TRIHA|nr:hypothetical protein THAR02_03254 [Trichoderma harzianum]
MVYLNLRGKKLLAGITISSGLGFILFGYDNGVIGGLLTAPDFESTFNLDSTLQGVVTSLFELGCFFGSLVTAVAGGRLGRRTLAHLGTLSITIGALLQASSFSVGQLMVGRIIAGIGLGLISSNIAIWQSETAPANVRGTLVACSLSFLIVGQLLANLIDYGMNSYSGPVTWRFPIAFQAVLALLMSALLFFMPECKLSTPEILLYCTINRANNEQSAAPRYLIMKDRIEETVEVLQALKDTNDRETVAAEIAEIKEALLLELNSRKSWTDLFKSDKVKSRRRVIIACIVNLMQDLSGSTPIAYYTTFIFQNSVGFSRHLSLLMSIFLQLWFLLASTLTWWLIERVGRRRLFMLSACCMGMVMAVVAAMLAVNTRTSGIVAVVMIFAYQAFFTWGFMGGVWVYGPEILPLEYRSKGMGLATATLWLFSFVMVEIVPSSISNIGWKTYIIFAVFNFSFIPIIYLFFPETKGLSLELVDLAFMDDSMSPVKRAKELHKMIASGEELTLRTEVADALSKLGYAHGGFLCDLTMYSPTMQSGKTKIIGQAYTIDTVPKDAILFISVPAHIINSVYGGLMSMRAQLLGAKGTIVDGRVRDLQEHRDLDYPVFARGIGTNAAAEVCFPSQINVPVRLNSAGQEAWIRPADILIGDLNGVVCIPREALKSCLDILPDIVNADTKCAEDILKGQSFAEVLRKHKGKL